MKRGQFSWDPREIDRGGDSGNGSSSNNESSNKNKQETHKPHSVSSISRLRYKLLFVSDATCSGSEKKKGGENNKGSPSERRRRTSSIIIWVRAAAENDIYGKQLMESSFAVLLP